MQSFFLNPVAYIWVCRLCAIQENYKEQHHAIEERITGIPSDALTHQISLQVFQAWVDPLF